MAAGQLPEFLATAMAPASQVRTVQSLNRDLHTIVTALRTVPGHRALDADEIYDLCGVVRHRIAL